MGKGNKEKRPLLIMGAVSLCSDGHRRLLSIGVTNKPRPFSYMLSAQRLILLARSVSAPFSCSASAAVNPPFLLFKPFYLFFINNTIIAVTIAAYNNTYHAHDGVTSTRFSTGYGTLILSVLTIRSVSVRHRSRYSVLSLYLVIYTVSPLTFSLTYTLSCRNMLSRSHLTCTLSL